MVTIRLSRGGAKGRPFYHVVVSDSRAPEMAAISSGLVFSARWRRPMKSGCAWIWRAVDYWIGVGAQLSDRVASLVKVSGARLTSPRRPEAGSGPGLSLAAVQKRISGIGSHDRSQDSGCR